MTYNPKKHSLKSYPFYVFPDPESFFAISTQLNFKEFTKQSIFIYSHNFQCSSFLPIDLNFHQVSFLFILSNLLLDFFVLQVRWQQILSAFVYMYVYI